MRIISFRTVLERATASVKTGTIQRRLAWPLRKDDIKSSRCTHFFFFFNFRAVKILAYAADSSAPHGGTSHAGCQWCTSVTSLAAVTSCTTSTSSWSTEQVLLALAGLEVYFYAHCTRHRSQCRASGSAVSSTSCVTV